MSFINRILDVRNARQRNYREEQSKRVAQEIRRAFHLSPVCSDYENLFSQVRPLINEMKMVRPFAVNDKGEKIKNRNATPELNLLDYPNEEMGWAEFADLMFATWLTKDQLYIHVHKGKRDKVIGYSIIPSQAMSWNGHEFIWTVIAPDGTQVELHKDEVMTLRFSRSPDDPFKGVSPATAGRAWAQTDDMVAQYQRAYFENGAIPQTITFITASTREKYEQTRYELESKLRGAENHNKTVYAWRQMLPSTGQTQDQIEVKTIQAPNNTLAIKEIVSIVNDRLNKAVGVSNFIMGDDSSAKYSNAELSQQQFIRNRVFPALMSFWSQFQFELDRITGGLGYGIQFELEIPELTERASVRAETSKKNADTLMALISAGADPTSTVRALELPDAWLRVAAGIYNKTLAGNNNQNTQPLLADGKSSSHAHACQCHDSHKTTDSLDDLTEPEQKLYRVLVDMASAIMANDPSLNQEDVIARVIEILEEESKKGKRKALTRLLELVTQPDVIAELEAELKNIALSPAVVDRIRVRAGLIVKNYDEEVRDVMRTVLENTRELTAREIEEKLREAIPRYRAAMIARTETNYAFKSVQVDDTLEIEQRAQMKFDFVWHCSQDRITCDVCAAMDGQRTPAGRAYEHILELDTEKQLVNGKVLDAGTIIEWTPSEWNDQGQIPQPHPNCRCYFDIVPHEEAR